MRKIILTFLGLMLSTGIGMAVSSSEDIIKELFTDNGITTSLSTDSSELKTLSQEEDAFNNVYLFMYQNVKKAPNDETLKILAENPDYSEYSTEDISSIVIDGDISKISEKLGSSVEQNTIIDFYTKMQSDYTEELELQTENRGLLYESLAKEIFYNNDLSDSASVDILYDLDLINYLLFNEYITYPDRKGNTSVDLASEEIFGTQKLSKIKRSTGSPSASVTTAVSNIVCSIDTELSDAIKKYEEANPESTTDSNSGDSDTTSGGTSSNSGSSSGSSSTSTSSTSSSTKTASSPTVDDFLSSLGGGTLGNWDRSLPCDEVFCITVDLIPGDAGVSTDSSTSGQTYEKTDDCIACHISYIAQKLNDTLSKPLSPSKVPMNNFEDGTCKEAGSKINLDINVYVQKKPIFTPEDDTTPDSSSNDVESLKELIYSSRALTNPDEVTGQTNSDLDSGRILSTLAGSDQEAVVNQILIANQAKMDQIQKLFADFELKARGQTYQDQEDQILIELATLKSYFSQFEDSLNATIAPIEDLAGKKYCE